MAQDDLQVLSCFAWRHAGIEAGTLAFPAFGICQVAGVLNPIGIERPVLICNCVGEPMDGYADNGTPTSMLSPWLLANGPVDIYFTEQGKGIPFGAYPMRQQPVWVLYEWREGVSEEPDSVGEWPKYWMAHSNSWKLWPYDAGLDVA